MQKTIIRTERLCKSFSRGGVQQHVLKNVDLNINNGDFTVIMGASGSGKSTLLYALSGMDKPTLGSVIFDGTELTGLSGDKLATFRREHCGFVFQSIHLLDNMSVLDNIMTAGLLCGKRKDVAAEAKQMLERVGIDEQTQRKFPSQLSGGEAQRVGLVRAAINHPDVIFADEPTGALNSKSGTDVLDLLTEFNRNGQTIIMVTHDIRSALRGNRILYLRDGCIEGELSLEPYAANNAPARSERLRTFLAKRGW